MKSKNEITSPWGLKERAVMIAPDIWVIMPANCRYVCVDGNGQVWAFSHVPTFESEYQEWLDPHHHAENHFQKHLRDVVLEDEDAKNLLWCK